MKTPQEYADELVDKYQVFLYGERDEYFESLQHPKTIQCAIIDVKNTVEAIDNEYYKEVLTILESKES